MGYFSHIVSATALILLTSGPATADTNKLPSKAKTTPKIDQVLKETSKIVRERTNKVSCSSLVEDLLAWVNERPAGPNLHRIGAKMTSAKISNLDGTTYPWGHGAYSEGAFGAAGTKLVGRFKVLFSDRQVGGDGNRFDHSRHDLQDVTLHADGRVEILLRNWGNTLLKLEDVACFQGAFVTGIKREGNGISVVSFALREEVATPDSHPGTTWP